jgi:hypothetical protein
VAAATRSPVADGDHRAQFVEAVDLRGDRAECRGVDERGGLRVVHDVGRFARQESGVDRHQRDARQRAADEDLDTFEAVGHERRDPVVGLDRRARCSDCAKRPARSSNAPYVNSRVPVRDRDAISVAGTRRREHLADVFTRPPSTVRGERHPMRQRDRRDRLVVEAVGVEQHGVAAIFLGMKDVDEQIAVALGGIGGAGMNSGSHRLSCPPKRWTVVASTSRS